MGTAIASKEEIIDSFEAWLKSQAHYGDITADTIADVYNELSKKHEWEDSLVPKHDWDKDYVQYNKPDAKLATVEEILWALWGEAVNAEVRFKDKETGEFRTGDLVIIKGPNELGALFG